METILVVDDNMTNLQFVSGQLADLYTVIPAKSGEQALRIIASRIPDAILLDADMPEMDGLETLARLRRTGRVDAIPIIFLTASDAPEFEARALEGGAQDFIGKPFEKDILVHRIGLHLRLARHCRQAAALPDGSGHAAPRRILLVDDNLTALKHAALQLSGTYEVIMAKSGGQALAIAAEKIPDLILLDIEMPGMDGFATLAALRQNAALSSIPVIFLTASHDLETQVKALAAGGVDFVRKPFEKEVLLHRIGLHLRLSGDRQRLRNA